MEQYNVIEMTNKYIQFIKDYFESSDNNIVIDVLGTLNNNHAITAALLVKALGKNRVIGLLMPNGFQLDIDDAFKLCEQLDIKYIVCNVDEAVAGVINSIKHSTYSSYTMNAVNASNQTKTDIVKNVRMIILSAISQNINGISMVDSDYNSIHLTFSDALTPEELATVGEYLGLSKEFYER